MSTHGYRVDRPRRKHRLLRIPTRARRLRLVFQHLMRTSRPPQSARPRRWPVRRSDLEVFLSADAPNDRKGPVRLQTERDSSA
jgi:hypothetical protein